MKRSDVQGVMKNMKTFKRHFGVYGVAVRDDHLLCICKTSGPYQYRYDLPGGSPMPGEGLSQTLLREVEEETGHAVRSYEHAHVVDAILHIDQEAIIIHHVGILYDIVVDDAETAIPKWVEEGMNDSSGMEWVAVQDLDPDNASALVLKAIEAWNEDPDALITSVYETWTVKEN